MSLCRDEQVDAAKGILIVRMYGVVKRDMQHHLFLYMIFPSRTRMG